MNNLYGWKISTTENWERESLILIIQEEEEFYLFSTNFSALKFLRQSSRFRSN